MSVMTEQLQWMSRTGFPAYATANLSDN